MDLKLLKKNILKFFLGSSSYRLANLLLVPIFVNNLEPSEFGLSDYYLTLSTLLTVVFSFGAADGVVKFLIDRSKNNETWAIAHIVGTVGGLGVAILMCFFLNDVQHSLLIWVLIVCSIYSSIVKAALRAYALISWHSYYEVISAIALFISVFLFVVTWHMGVQGFLLGYVVATLIPLIIGYYQLNKIAVMRLPRNFNDVIAFIKFSIPIMPSQIAWWFSVWILRETIVSFGDSPQDLADFALASKIGGIFSFLANSVSQGWYLAVYNSSESFADRLLFKKIIRTFILLSIISVTMAFFCSKYIVMLISNDHYAGASSLIPLVLTLTLLNTLNILVAAFYFQKSKTVRASLESVFFMVSIVLITRLFADWSVHVLISACVFAQLILFINRVVFVKKRLKLELL